jgi:hypothetical protein
VLAGAVMARAGRNAVCQHLPTRFRSGEEEQQPASSIISLTKVSLASSGTVSAGQLCKLVDRPGATLRVDAATTLSKLGRADRVWIWHGNF